MIARRFWGGAMFTAGIVAGLLLLATSIVSLGGAGHAVVVQNRLKTIAEHQSQLRANTLELRYGLISNYDGINAALAALQRELALLTEDEIARAAAADAADAPRLRELLRKYAAALTLLGDNVERFKTSNALLKNSLQAFPRLSEQLAGELAGSHAAVGKRVNELLLTTMRFGLSSDMTLAEAITQDIMRLRMDGEALPLPLRRQLANVLDHSTLILRVHPNMDQLTHSIAFAPTEGMASEMTQAVQQGALYNEKRAGWALAGLAALTALSLALAVHYLRRLWKSTRELEENHRFMDCIGENIGDGVLATDKGGLITFANPEAARQLGCDSAALLGHPLGKVLPPGRTLTAHAERKSIRSMDERLQRCDGSLLPVALAYVAVAEPGQLGGVLMIHDITEILEREKDLRLAATVFEHNPYGITITDKETRILRVNPAFSRITGYVQEEVAGQKTALLSSGMQNKDFYRDMWQALNATGHWYGELQNRRKNSEIYPEWLTIQAVKNKAGEVSHYVGIFSDITERKQSERRIERLANYDPLTGLPNRVLLHDRLAQAMARVGRGNHVVALIYTGLDHFKVVNETLGARIGDALLIAVAERLQSGLREADTLCRVGGDQFALLLEDIGVAGNVDAKVQAVMGMMKRPFLIEGHELFTTLSVGIALAPQDASDVATLQRNAETAMFGAKAMGRNVVKFYSADMSARVAEVHKIENGLRRALEGGELSLHYQPQLCLTSQRVVSAEALIRWNSPELGQVSPMRFIPVAEKCGLITPIGEWTLRTACAQIATWRRAGLIDLRVAVNLSAVQFRQTNLVDLVERVLAEQGLPGSCLELEITETVVMEDIERSLATLKELRGLGCMIAIDDFGTGYSSLSYLKQFPIDALKIDRSFVNGLGRDSSDAAVVNMIIGLASSLSLKVIAEGIETETQREFLTRQNTLPMSILLQGYLFSRPLAVDKLNEFMAALKAPNGIALALQQEAAVL